MKMIARPVGSLCTHGHILPEGQSAWALAHFLSGEHVRTMQETLVTFGGQGESSSLGNESRREPGISLEACGETRDAKEIRGRCEAQTKAGTGKEGSTMRNEGAKDEKMTAPEKVTSKEAIDETNKKRKLWVIHAGSSKFGVPFDMCVDVALSMVSSLSIQVREVVKAILEESVSEWIVERVACSLPVDRIKERAECGCPCAADEQGGRGSDSACARGAHQRPSR